MADNLIASLLNGVVQAASNVVGNVQTRETNKISKEANEIAKQANEIAMMASKPTLGFTGKLLWSDKDAAELYYEKTADMAHAMDVDGWMSELEDVAVLTVRIRNLGKEEINRVGFLEFAVWKGTLRDIDSSQGVELFLHVKEAATVDISMKAGEEKDINVILPLDKNWDDRKMDELRDSVENGFVAVYATFRNFTVSGESYEQTGAVGEYKCGVLWE
ncbi:MAG: hypothetical protein LUH19_01215 [Lachnospiraceae bacterium]|nr:hypothetical protein [Lachnospiraceae bacterium]